MENRKPIYINISSTTIIKIILIFIMFYFFYLIREILAVLFVSLVLASAIDPWVDWMQERKIPRGIGVIIIYLILFLAVGLVTILIVPPIIQELGELYDKFPQFLEKAFSGAATIKDYSLKYGFLENVKSNIGSITSHIQQAIFSVFSTVSGVFGSIISFFLVLVITFYMTVEENAIKKVIWSIVPKKHQIYSMQLVNRMQKKIGLWLRGQLILSLIIFILTYLGLLILNIKYALVLALIAGMTEFIPYLGPILASIPAIFLAFTQSHMLAVFVAVLYYIIQLTENNIIVPKLMQKVVGLNPIVSIAVLLIGLKVAGVAGAILSIPVATAVSVFIKDYFEHK